MKAAACAILVLLALHQAEALTCNYCYSKGSKLCTSTTTQTCSRRMDACATVILPAPLNNSFRSCMNMAICKGYIQTPGVIASCCSTDLCNSPHLSLAPL
ncbi:lymphocyte antigen 6D [Paralichthys olivaceus]|uniref:Uncharacterized protein n=1 Tax=Paralichthys olivaceus TaxID=8255 RepID=A8WDH6_PAROL|nr:PREDICTED: lymphocyte antigen 6D-like [Paralichthys olivaceus]ABW90561.1 hypothetical protein [Paralichthys olivaceus]ABW90563.1 hypothetical protein [Paralichthys olivaceus]